MDKTTDMEQQNTESGKKSGINAANLYQTIPVMEEQLLVDKKVVETGKVKISKTVTRQETSVDIPLVHEEYDIQRVPINKYVEKAPPAVRHEGDTMIVPVLREVLVVEKHYEIMEEIHITKRKVEKQETQQVTLLKENIHIERTTNKTDNEGGD